MTPDPSRLPDRAAQVAAAPTWPACLAVALAAAIAFLLAVQPEMGAYDEALILYGASRVLHGDVPYRDFWTLYGPGAYYVLAALFHVFGESVAVGRCFDLVVRVVIVVTSYAIVARAGRRRWALAVAFVECAALVAVEQPGSPAFPAVACVLLAFHFLAGGPDGARSVGKAAAGGVFAGLALLFRTDLGLYGWIACAVLVVGLHRRAVDRAAASRWRRAAGLGLLAVVVPAAVALGLAVPLRDLFDDLVRIPLQVYPQMRSLPWPGFTTLAFEPSNPDILVLLVYTVPLATIACALVLWRGPTRGAQPSGRDRVVARAAVALAALLLLKGLVRVSPEHMAPSLAASIVAVALTLAVTSLTTSARWFVGIAAAICLWPLVATVQMLEKKAVFAAKWAARGEVPVLLAQLADDCMNPPLPRLRCATTTPHRVAVARFLVDNTPAERPVYVGAGRHDKLFVNDVLLYFLSGTFAPTKWYDLHPGVQTTAAVQSQMIEDMRRHPPAWVVRNTTWDAHEEPNRSRFGSGVTLLDDYLDKTYAPQFRRGPYVIERPLDDGLR